VVPFEQTIPDEERDPKVKERLRDPRGGEAPAILAWAVEGCLAWQHEGLAVPDAIRAATQSYRAEMATFSQFIEDQCEERPELWSPSDTMMFAYKCWSTSNGYRYPLGPKRLAERLRALGHLPEKRQGVRGWRGIALKTRSAG
jgi:putative DNA primase/helicase